MRSIIIAVILIFPLSASAALTDSLQAYWTLDETSSTRQDSTANNNDLSDNNTTSYVTGKIGNALDCQGTNQYLSIADASQTGLDLGAGGTDFSLSFWVDTDVAVTGWLLIGSKDGGEPNRTMAFGWVESSGDKYGGAESNTGYNAATQNIISSAPSGGDFSTNTWYHIVWTVDMSAKAWKFYRNGSLDATHTGSYTSLYNSAAAFTLCKYFSSYFNGQLDEFGIWSRELTSTEVSELYNSGSGLAYPFTGGGGGSTPASQESDLIFFMYAPLPDRLSFRYG